MISFHDTIFCRYRTPFNDRKQISLNSFPAYVGANTLIASCNFIYLIKEYNSIVFHGFFCHADYFILINQIMGLCISKNFSGSFYTHLSPFFLARHDIGQHIFQIGSNFFHTKRAEHLHLSRKITGNI